MVKNYLKIAWRHLLKNKMYSFINIGGLAVGMAVAMLICLWVYDELSFEKYHKNYNQVVQVLSNNQVGDGVSTESSMPLPLSLELKSKYGSDFEYVSSTLNAEQAIVYENNVFLNKGSYVESSFADIFTVDMLYGAKQNFEQGNALFLNETVAKTLFGNTDPIGRVVKLNGVYTVQIGGVYKDFPMNTRFHNISFLAPIQLLFTNSASTDNWYSSSFNVYAKLNTSGKLETISAKIKDVLYSHTQDATKPVLFLNPMSKWHLFQFQHGIQVNGRMDYIWLFSSIAFFIVLLACINFMNLNTAKSQKRAKEVGIRKAVGTKRSQLISQFLSESFLTTLISFIISILLVSIFLPYFNVLANTNLGPVFNNGYFLLFGFLFSILVGLLAGSYPAFYLSSFRPIAVLKSNHQMGKFALYARKSLVIIQYTVSVALIIGTLIVLRQIQFAKDRPIGFTTDGVGSISFSPELKNYTAFKNEVLTGNEIEEIAASGSPSTGIYSYADNLDWDGKDPNRQELFGTILIEPGFAHLTRWEMKEGRNFSNEFVTDSMAFVLNETASNRMGLKNPLGQTVKWHGKNWKIIGVVKDMVMRSPFESIIPTVFLMNTNERNFSTINFKLNTSVSPSKALSKIEQVYKKYAPNSPFNFKFADQQHELKFADQERVGKFILLFAIIAISIACLGLFGLATFTAEQRTKEIGVRKVLGASVSSITALLSKDFLMMVIIGTMIASPIAYYFMHGWLQDFAYRIEIEWWIFVVSGIAAILIAFLTVSYQSVKAALMNPVRAIRTE